MYNGLKKFSERVISFKDAIQNEAQTRSVLIDPVLKMLGYDTANPFEVITEYTCDIGTKKGEKIDYALLKDNEIVMLVEAKDCKVKLNEKNIGQLFRYYSVSSARVALLTNGIEYLFFTDTTKQNVMDYEPFFVFNILDFTEEDAEVMNLFKKDIIDSEKIRDYAFTSSFRSAFMDYFIQQAISPSNDFVSFITKNIGLTNINSTDASNLVSNELARLLQENIDLTFSKKRKLVEKHEKELEKEEVPKKKVKGSEDKNGSEEKLIGINVLSEFNNKNIVGTKPISVTFDKDTYEVKSWHDILISLLLYCFKLNNSVDFICSLDGLGQNKGWIRTSSEGMRTPREIENTGIFVNTHGSSQETLRKIRRICKEINFSEENVLVELK